MNLLSEYPIRKPNRYLYGWELQDIHYQGRELKEAPAPLGYH